MSWRGYLVAAGSIPASSAPAAGSAKAHAVEHAQRCRQLALRAPSAQAEVSYLDTARAWEQRAAEIEGAQAFVKTMAQIGVRSEPEAA